MTNKLLSNWLTKTEMEKHLVDWRIKDLLPENRKRAGFTREINKYVDRFYNSKGGVKAGNCKEIDGVKYFRAPAVALWLKEHYQNKWHLIPDDLIGSDVLVTVGAVQATAYLFKAPKLPKKKKTLSQKVKIKKI